MLDFRTDPAVPPIPPHAMLEQVEAAEAAAAAVIHGNPDRPGMVRHGVKAKIQEFLPGGGREGESQVGHRYKSSLGRMCGQRVAVPAVSASRQCASFDSLASRRGGRRVARGRPVRLGIRGPGHR